VTDDHLHARVRALITAAVAGLDPADRAERIAYCQAQNEHGTRMIVEDGVLEFHWGGRRLALVAAADLSGTDPLLAVFGTDVPDTVPDGWGER
jgi:hypothetical protein